MYRGVVFAWATKVSWKALLGKKSKATARICDTSTDSGYAGNIILNIL